MTESMNATRGMRSGKRRLLWLALGLGSLAAASLTVLALDAIEKIREASARAS